MTELAPYLQGSWMPGAMPLRATTPARDPSRRT